MSSGIEDTDLFGLLYQLSQLSDLRDQFINDDTVRGEILEALNLDQYSAKEAIQQLIVNPSNDSGIRNTMDEILHAFSDKFRFE